MRTYIYKATALVQKGHPSQVWEIPKKEASKMLLTIRKGHIYNKFLGCDPTNILWSLTFAREKMYLYIQFFYLSLLTFHFWFPSPSPNLDLINNTNKNIILYTYFPNFINVQLTRTSVNCLQIIPFREVDRHSLHHTDMNEGYAFPHPKKE